MPMYSSNPQDNPYFIPLPGQIPYDPSGLAGGTDISGLFGLAPPAAPAAQLNVGRVAKPRGGKQGAVGAQLQVPLAPNAGGDSLPFAQASVYRSLSDMLSRFAEADATRRGSFWNSLGNYGAAEQQASGARDVAGLGALSQLGQAGIGRRTSLEMAPWQLAGQVYPQQVRRLALQDMLTQLAPLLSRGAGGFTSISTPWGGGIGPAA